MEFARKELNLDLWSSQSLTCKLVYGGQLTVEERGLLVEWQRGDPEFGGAVVYHPEHLCRELALICGVRSSKTFMGGLLASYESYRFLMLPDPYTHYGLAENSPIFGMIAATSRETAQDTVFAQLSQMLRHDFFEAHGLELYKREARFPDYHFTVRCGASTSANLVGRTTLFAILDELDLLPDTRGRLGGHGIYSSMSKGTTTLNGLNVSLTSPLWETSKSSELEKIAPEIQTMVYIRQPTWMFNPSPNERRDSPKIRDEFLKDPEGAARDYGAAPSRAISPFFRDPEILERCFTGKNPISATGLLQDFPVDHSAVYAVAGDPAPKHDAFGVAMGHRERSGKIVIDLVWAFVPDPKAGIVGEVDPHDVKTFYLSLIGRAPVTAALFDTYVYMDVRHALHNRGVEVLQNHVKLEEYQTLKDYVYSSANEREGQTLVLPDDFRLRKEMLGLEQRKGRIDHPPKGSKDVADCVAQIVYYLDKVEASGGSLPGVVG